MPVWRYFIRGAVSAIICVSDVAGEFPVDDVVENCRKVGNFDAKQNREGFSLSVPPVPEEIQPVKNGQ